MIYKSYLIEQNFNLIKEKIVLFYGENLGLKGDFKNKIKISSKNSQIVNLLQEDIIKNEKSFFNELLNFSLFENKKIFFINNSTDKILPIIQKIDLENFDQSIFLFSDILEKKSKLRNYFEKTKFTGIVPCYEDNSASLKKIIIERLSGFSNLTPENINIILENCSMSRLKLNNELDKIIIFFKDKKINTHNLQDLLNENENENFNDLKDEALNGNKSKTNKLISDTFLDNEKTFLYLNLINQRLNKLVEIHKLTEKNSLDIAINNCKPPIFWKDKPNILLQSKKWKIEKIRESLNKIYSLEIKIKSSSFTNNKMLIKKLLVDLCHTANA